MLERLDLAENLGLVVSITKVFTILINCGLVPVSAVVNEVFIDTPWQYRNGFVVHCKARV
eukprot:10930453-Ditylum_brightwellii.AAC.1